MRLASHHSDAQYRAPASGRAGLTSSRISHWFKWFGLPTLILFMLSQLVFDGEIWTLIIYITFGIGLILFVVPYLFVGALGAAISGLFIDTRRSALELLFCYTIGPALMFLGLPWVAHTFAVPAQTMPANAQQALPAGVDISDLTLNFRGGLSDAQRDDHIRAIVSSGQVKRLMVTQGGRLDNYKYYDIRPNLSCGKNLYRSCLERKKFYLSNSYVLDVSGIRPDKANPVFRFLSPISDYIVVSLKTPDGEVMGRATAHIQRPLTQPLSFGPGNNGSSLHLPDTILSRGDIIEDPLGLLMGLDKFFALSSGLRALKITPPVSKLISDEDFESEIIRRRFTQKVSQNSKPVPVQNEPKVARVSRNYQGFIYTARRRNWPQKDIELLSGVLAEPGQDCDFVDDALYPAAMIAEKSGAVARATFKCLAQRQNVNRKTMAEFNEGLAKLSPSKLKPYTADIVALFEQSTAVDVTALWPILMQSDVNLKRVWKRQLSLDNRSTFTTMQALDQICSAPTRHQETGLAALHARLNGFGGLSHPRARGTSMSARVIAILDGFDQATPYIDTVQGIERKHLPKFIAQRQAAGSACPPWGDPPY